MDNKYLNNKFREQYNLLKNVNNVNNNSNLEELSNSHITTKNILLNIDSKNRNLNSKNIIEATYKLPNDPIIFNPETNNNLIYIILPNHNLKINDKITVNNVNTPIIHITYENINFYNNSEYIKFNYNIFNDNLNFPNYSLNESVNKEIDKYEPYFIEIMDIYYSNNNKFINNIPLNILKGIHKIYFNINIDNENKIDNLEYNLLNFFIKLPIKYLEDNIDNNNFTLKFKFLNIAGIPLNKINSNLPLSHNQLNEYLLVDEIINKNIIAVKSKNIIVHKVNNLSTINTDTDINIIKGCGGNNIIIEKIKKIIKGYPNSNNYQITFNTLNNIKSIQLISCDFPHSEYNVIKNKNNKFYFNILHDGDYEYQINIDEGYYTIDSLTKTIQNNISNLFRIDNGKSEINDFNVNLTKYKLLPKINYNINTNKVSFKILEKVKISNCITSVNKTDKKFILNINHMEHFLEENTLITISNCEGTEGISSNLINGEHKIVSIIDNNNYIIEINNLKIDNTIKVTNGGIHTIISYELKIRLRFEKKDTIGELLGFNYCGKNNSITIFDYEISNDTLYVNQINTDNEFYNTIKRFNFNDKNYILLYCNLLFNINDNNGIIKTNNFSNILLAKIYLDNLGNRVYNSFVNLTDEFECIIPNINTIEFFIKDRNNNLYEFGNLDHSFILNFRLEKIQDKYTNINSQTGLSNVTSSLNKVFIDNDNNKYYSNENN